MMDNKLIIEMLAQAVRDGRMKLDDIPQIYREQVEAKLNED